MAYEFKIAILVGSTRSGSINECLARAIERVAPKTLGFYRVSMEEMPFYDADLEGNRPQSVKAFVDAISRADAVCIVTPEYNRSIPAILKNAIDWASKPTGASVWREKIIATCGTSPGAIGTAIGQQHLRQILASIGAYVLPGDTFISFNSPNMIDIDGKIANENVHEIVKNFTIRFEKFISLLSNPGSGSRDEVRQA